VRLIHKYPNRRLYDKSESRYITLDDLRNLVLSGVEFAVQDRRSQEDITRATLLQVLTAGEDAANSQPVLDKAFLRKAIQVQSSVTQQQSLGNAFESMLLEQRAETASVVHVDRPAAAMQSQIASDGVVRSI
jgi:polyhydroxyalkanoate synthesis repressor PhaR